VNIQTEKLPLRQVGKSGWWVLEIRGERDIPSYNPRVIGKGLDEQTYRREVLGDWTAVLGKLVYPEFGPVHCASTPLPFDPDLPLILGWDVGGSPWSGTPACCITQVNYYGQWLIYPPVTVPEEESVDILDFARDWVAPTLYEGYAEPHGLELEQLKIYHYGDPAGNSKPPKHMTGHIAEVRSCYETINLGEKWFGEQDEYGDREILEKPGLGWLVQSAEGRLTRRLQTIKTRLGANLKGNPALIVDPDATAILDGFQGGYHYHQRADGRYELDPMKNWWSHIMDALSYAASGLAYCTGQREEEEYGGYNPHATGAATWGHRRRD
jgi:hypothetical protein